MKAKLIFVTVLAMVAMLMAGCMPSASPGLATPAASTGRIEVRVTDAPPREEVTSVMITFSAVEVHKAVAEQEQEQEQGGQQQEQEQEQDGDGDGNGEWVNITLDANKQFDLVKLKKEDIEGLLVTAEIGTGKYTQIRLTVEGVAVTYKYQENGVTKETTVPAVLPSDKLKLIHPFDITEDGTTILLVDFDADKSVHFTGQGKIMVKPVVKLTVTQQAPKEALQITTVSLPNGGVGIAYTTTLEATGGKESYSWSITAGSLQADLTLNATTGVISGTPTTPGDFTFTVQATDSSVPAKIASRSYTITIAAAGDLIITTTSLSAGKVGEAYSAQVAAIGGTSPYNWSVTTGTLPAGLTLTALNATTGVISGIPTAVGTANSTVQATDSAVSPDSDSQDFSIQIAPAAPLKITTTSLANGRVGVAYSATIEATGGIKPYTWSVVTGSLPATLTLDANTGIYFGNTDYFRRNRFDD